jgi:hypothetical protein
MVLFQVIYLEIICYPPFQILSNYDTNPMQVNGIYISIVTLHPEVPKHLLCISMMLLIDDLNMKPESVNIGIINLYWIYATNAKKNHLKHWTGKQNPNIGCYHNLSIDWWVKGHIVDGA